MKVSINLIAIGLTASLSAEDDDRCDWARVDGRDLSQKDFDSMYFEKKPVVLQNLLDEWPAYAEGLWDKDRVLDNFGSYPFNTSHLAPNCRILSEVHDGTLLRDHLSSGLPASWFVYPHHPMVGEMRARKEFVVPSLLQAVTATGPCVSVGYKMQGNILHDHETNWLAQVRGRKRWLVRPPGEDRYPVISRAGRMEEGPCSPPPPWPNISICVVRAGEIAYLPSYWFHETCVLDEWNVGVAYIGSAPQQIVKASKLDYWRATAEGNLTYLQQHDTSQVRSIKNVLLAPAIQNGHAAVVQWLLNQRADLHGAADGTEADGVALTSQLPSLHTAAYAGHASMSKLLLNSNAALLQPDKKGLLPVHWASIHGHVPVLQQLIEFGAEFADHESSGTPVITFAAANGHTGCVKHMLSKGVSATTSSEDSSPLLAAVRDGHSLVAKLLLEGRADIHARRAEDGDQCVHLAAQGSSKKLMPLLYAHGADMFSENSEGLAPMHVAARAGNLHIMRWLAEKKVDQHKPDGKGITPAFWAAQAGHAEAIVFFSKQGVDLNEPISNGFTPLNIAAAEGHPDVVRALLAVDGVDREAKTHGNSPLKWAQLGGNDEVVSILKEASNPKSSRKKRRRKQKSGKASDAEL